MDTDELRKLLDEATPGPWTWDKGRDDLSPIWTCGMSQGCGYIDWSNSLDGPDPARPWMNRTPTDPEANARLIALAPTLARKVIAAEKLAEALREISMHCRNSGIEYATVGERVAERCEDTAVSALAAWEAAK